MRLSRPPFAFEKKGPLPREVYIQDDEYRLYDAQHAHTLQRRLGQPEEPVPQRTLYVVLERASMEICRAAPSGHPRHGKVKPTLLTCDDHQGLLVRMGREVSDARPDITHQVSSHIILPAMKYASSASAVPLDFAGLAVEQGGTAQDIHPHDARSIN